MMSRNRLQQCPICGAIHPANASRCNECGAALSGALAAEQPVAIHSSAVAKPPTPEQWDAGEADLYEGALPPVPLHIIGGILTTLVVVIGLVVFGAVYLSQRTTPNTQNTDITPTDAAIHVNAQATPTIPLGTIPATNTKIAVAVIPTQADLPSITPTPTQPPTATIAPTRGPCVQKAKAGDTLMLLALRCGYHDMSGISVILAANNMKDPSQLQVGQTLQIPWPTPKDAAAAPPGSTIDPNAAGSATVNPELALAPGQQWYIVKKGDTGIGILIKFKTDMKTFHDLNPQLQFDQCDFSSPIGGPTCQITPLLAPGMQLRVPAPLPTPTLSPTPNGSETATPSATATFNLPVSISPSDNTLFLSGLTGQQDAQIPVLRWTSTGTLNPSQVYLVSLEDVTAGQTYYVTTSDTSYPLPLDWQPSNGKRHVFAWSVAVADVNQSSGTPVPSDYHTATLTFVWESR